MGEMEIFREIHERFDRMEAAQRDVVAYTQGAVDAITRELVRLKAKHEDVLQEMTQLRGAFAGIEAILIANAAQIYKLGEEVTTVKSRLDALERKAS